MSLMSAWSRRTSVVVGLGCGLLLVTGCATGQNAEPVPLPADAVWRFFCFGCALPYHEQSEEEALSPYDAQRLWVAFWAAVERGDAGEVRLFLHSSFPAEAAAELARPGMAGEARTFLYQCS